MNNLKEIRQSHNKTLKEISNLLGYKYAGGYHKIEKGKQKITLEQARKLSTYYGIDIKNFFE